MLALCPKCHKAIMIEEPGWNICKYCKERVWIPDPLNPAAQPEKEPETAKSTEKSSEGTPIPIPWEEPVPGISPAGFFKTLSSIMFRGSEFFSSLDNSPVTSRPKLFALIVLSIGLIIFFQLQALSFAMLESMQKLSDVSHPVPPFMQQMIDNMTKMKINSHFFLLSAILSPVFAIAIIWVTKKVFISAFLFSQKHPIPISKITRIVCYSYTPWLLLALPLIGIIWTVVLQYNGLKKGLGLSARLSIILVALNLVIINLGYDLWIQIHMLLVK